jgi:CheY-like chemotaxis protein
MDIHVAISGAEAIGMVRQNSYDLVFMDHMMPGMDGIEATIAIRQWESSRSGSEESPVPEAVPIIALTANALSGMREMFIEKGFNDFLAKPIEIAKLNEIIAKWIPKRKQVKIAGGSVALPSPPVAASALKIEGLDVEKGITMTGGTEEAYRMVLGLYAQDAEERLEMFKALPQEDENSEWNLRTFTIQAHALKSASATVGADEISKRAAELEAAGKTGNMALIREKLPRFYEGLKQTTQAIHHALAAVAGAAAASQDAAAAEGEAAVSASFPIFQELRDALQRADIETADRIIGELNANTSDPASMEALMEISNQVLMAEYEKAIEIINALIK